VPHNPKSTPPDDDPTGDESPDNQPPTPLYIPWADISAALSAAQTIDWQSLEFLQRRAAELGRIAVAVQPLEEANRILGDALAVAQGDEIYRTIGLVSDLLGPIAQQLDSPFLSDQVRILTDLHDQRHALPTFGSSEGAEAPDHVEAADEAEPPEKIDPPGPVARKPRTPQNDAIHDQLAKPNADLAGEDHDWRATLTLYFTIAIFLVGVGAWLDPDARDQLLQLASALLHYLSQHPL
jgi:hypothetical protein